MIKRGQLVLKFLIILSISGLILLLFPKLAEVYGKGDISRKNIAAREIALLIDTMYAYPYDMTIYYKTDLSGFTVEISEEYVVVYDLVLGKALDPSLARYKFFPTGSKKLDFKFENPKRLNFEKINNNLVIKKDEDIQK